MPITGAGVPAPRAAGARRRGCLGTGFQGSGSAGCRRPMVRTERGPMQIAAGAPGILTRQITEYA
ncbi:hypothetical protein DC28_13495 [Spirochaeta lutea]|uniref:Uncharacterized protein n=1 Tax=Spirochaeta lutea TaxID=1480694 RepID=A0A098QTB6_9SPIO|nr:hypothetical protein DC28_13495 [Spirochaeta lutea]